MSAAPVRRWKPFRTAPRDGSKFVAFDKDTGVVAVVHYAQVDRPLPWISNLLGTKGYGVRVFGDGYFTHWIGEPK